MSLVHMTYYIYNILCVFLTYRAGRREKLQGTGHKVFQSFFLKVFLKGSMESQLLSRLFRNDVVKGRLVVLFLLKVGVKWGYAPSKATINGWRDNRSSQA